MKNKFADLNNHLFAALERISDDELKGKKLSEEIQRAQSISNVARQIIGNANLVMKAKKLVMDTGMTTDSQRKLPEFFDENPKLTVINGDSKKQG